MHLLFCAEVTVVFNTFQVFVAGELCDLCRWHIIFTEGLNHGFPSAGGVYRSEDPLSLTFLS